ncbi:NmrA-like domain [Lasallia pustulata]|uniref:NmrA-like domain n=1 Tax=Lasallia pustulata TaxID=136370 RepID=A0A1W5CVT2_9LECA|nr:NmrA-like domain [Lasallia pustulata]
MAGGYGNDQPHGFSNRIEKVAIVGAGGQVGKHIAEHLLKTGKHVVTAIARPSSTSKLPEGVQVARVDYSGDDDVALVEALRQQQVLIITMSRAAPSDTISKLVRAAAKAGVPYVLPNWFGLDAANNTLCNDCLFSRDSICAEIESLGISSYLLLVCNFWYEFSLGGGPDRYGFDFKKRSLVLFDHGNVVVNTSTWPQCGRAIANLLSLKELPDDETDRSPTLSQFRNGSIYISSFRLSQRDMFESVKRVTRTTDADWTITHESAEQRWKDGQAALRQGNMEAFPKMLYSRMFFPNGDGDYQSSRGLHNDLLGLPVDDLDEFTAIGVRIGENGEVPQ